ncbi:MAG: hypothetical protein ACXABY_27575 [Candidatus Thorarchaeota archaeon]|jgi:hypothetical protein
MEEKSNHIAVIDGKKNKTIATLWWDGKRIQSDNEKFLASLKHVDGLHFSLTNKHSLDELLQRFKNGYIHAYKVGK